MIDVCILAPNELFIQLLKVCVFCFRWVIERFFLLCRFIKGLPVNHAALSEELKQFIGLEPMPKGISYVISTKVHKHVSVYDLYVLVHLS